MEKQVIVSVSTNPSVHKLVNTASCVPAPIKEEAVYSLLFVALDNNTHGESAITREEIYEIITS